MQGTFFRGTTHTQDARFSDKEKKLMQTMSFDEILDKRVDLKNVDLEIFEPWVDQQVTKILGIEDEVIPAMIINELDSYKQDNKPPNGKLIQIRVTGFLERDAKKFIVDLWKLLLEAQNSPHGIPTSLIDSKKLELKDKEEQFKKSQEQLKLLEEAKKKLEQDEKKLKELSRLFTDRSSSVERKQNKQKQETKDTTDKEVKSNDKRHRESLKKFEEDEFLDKKDKRDTEKKDKKRSSSSSRSRSKKDHKRKDNKSHKSRRSRDRSSSDRDNKYKEKNQRENKHKSSKSKRDRSRS